MELQIQEIHKILQKLTGLHRQLMDVVRLERDALVAADLRGVQDATLAKQGLIEEIRQAESDRLKRTGELALILKRPLRDLTLPEVIIVVQGVNPKLADQLRTAFNALTILIKHITEQNQSNAALVQNSLSHINEMKKNILGETVPKSNTYSAQGKKSSAVNGARLISKEA